MIACRVIAGVMIGLVAAQGSAGQMQPRPYPTGVSLISEGQATCVVVCPAGPGGWQSLARQVADGLAALGAPQVPIILDTEAVGQRLGSIRPELREKNLILLGDLNTNRAVFPLYANYYCYCDARYPGPNGFVLRTVVRPFGQDANYLLIGGSTQQSVSAGVSRLLARLDHLPAGRDVVLPYLLEVELGAEMSNLLDPFLRSVSDDHADGVAGRPGGYGHELDRFTGSAHLYFYTGDERFAERARDAMMFLVDYEPGAIRVGDYTMENLAAAWRRVSCSPAFTSEQRQIIDTRLLETVIEHEQSWWRQKDASKGIGGRHHTTGMLAWWTLIRVLLELGQPDELTRGQLEQWRSECQAYLDGLARHYWDDLDDYQSADSVQNTASFCLQTGRLAWFEKGLARRAAQKLLSLTDNLGWYAGIQGYGEALPGWERFTLDGGLLLGACGFVYEDAGFRWIVDRFPMLDHSWGALQPWGLHQFATGEGASREPPDWLTGLQVVRLTPYRLERINSGAFLNSPLMDGSSVTGLKPTGVSAGQAFDKLVIRSGIDPSDAYLLLQGHSGTALSTIDVNSIVRHTDQGQLWLLHNTGRRSLFFKNAVHVSRGIDDEPLPAACELVAQRDFDQTALVASRLADYRGTTWTRSLAVLPNRFTVVIDQVRINEPGHYMTCCTWRTPAFATLEGSHWISRQGDVTFNLLSGGDARLTSSRLAMPDGACRPTVLRQQHSVTAKPGDNVVFENLFYTSGPARRQAYELRRVAPGAVIVRQQDGDADGLLYLVAASDHRVELDGLSTDAGIVVIGPGTLCSINGTFLRIEDTHVPLASGSTHITPELSTKLNALLSRHWAGARLARPTESKPDDDTPHVTDNPDWAYEGFCRRAGLVDGVRLKGLRNVRGDEALATDWILPALRAEPRLSPQRGSGISFDSDTKKKTPDPATGADASSSQEVSLSPITGAEFVLELPQPMRIDELNLFGDTLGETASSLPPAELELELTFREKETQGKRRTRRVSVAREATYHNLYKGHSYLFECYRIADLNEHASVIHVRVVRAPFAEMILSDVQIRSRDSRQTQTVNVCAVDLDNDTRDEILAWTNEGELAVLDADGAERWLKYIPTGIIAAGAWDIEDDGQREVLVSRADRRVVVLNSDGSLRWEKDFSNMYRVTDERLYGDGSIVYGLAAWQPADAAGKELLCTSYWYAAALDPGGNLIRPFKRRGHFTQIRAVPADLAGGGGLVIRSDVPWVGSSPLEWWTNGTAGPVATCQVPNGQTVFFEVDDYDRDGRAEALVATEQGVSLCRAEESRSRWQHMADAPLVGVAVVQPDEKRPAQFACARQDGYLFILGIDGTVLNDTVIDAPLTCLTAVRAIQGEPILLLGTESSLRCLRLADLSELWRRPGTYQHLMHLGANERGQVVAVTRSGQLTGLKLDQVEATSR